MFWQGRFWSRESYAPRLFLMQSCAGPRFHRRHGTRRRSINTYICSSVNSWDAIDGFVWTRAAVVFFFFYLFTSQQRSVWFSGPRRNPLKRRIFLTWVILFPKYGFIFFHKKNIKFKLKTDHGHMWIILFFFMYILFFLFIYLDNKSFFFFGKS